MKSKRGRPKSVFKIEGEIVGFDELGPNPNNPYEHVNPKTREEALSALLAEIILRKLSTSTLGQGGQ